MSTNSNPRAKEPTMYLAICMIGIFLVLLAAYAHGQQVHQLSYNNANWADQDLGGSFTDSLSSVGAFITTPNDALHVYYLSDTDDVHQLYNVGTGWQDEDLTVETDSVPANNGSNIVGFSIGNVQYVFYVGVEFNIHELVYTDHWTDTDLTYVSGAPISNGSELAAFVTTPNNAIHLYYVTPGPYVMQLYNVGGGWGYENLTAKTGGPQPQGRWLSGFSIGNLQYVYYVAWEGDVHQLSYNNSTWSDEDLTAQAKMVPSPMYPNGGLSAMVIPGSKKMRVYYIGTNNHMIQLSATNNKKWTGADLTKKTKGPLANAWNGIVAFATTPNNQIHVFYLAGSHVNQLFLPTPATKWSNQDLTALTSGGLAQYPGGMAGFSIGNLQYVYYLGN